MNTKPRPSKDDEKLWRELGLDVELHRRVVESIAANYARQVESRPSRPAGMSYFDGVIHGAHSARVREIMARKAAGAKFVGTFCIYVPEEILIALDAIFLALCGGTAVTIPYAEKEFPRNMCPLVKSTLGLAFSKTCPYGPLEDLAVGETTCDAKKKTWDVLGKEGGFHVLEVPQKKSPAGRRLWLEEVRAFAVRIEELTGRKLDAEKLAGAVRLMNRKRRALARLHDLRKGDRPPISGTDALVVMQASLIDDPGRFAEAVERLNEELAVRSAAGVSPFAPGVPRIMVSGCPSVLGNWKIHHLIESAGAAIVVDETCTGTRYFTGEVRETEGGLDAQLEAVAERYLGVDCSCFTPNFERIENVVRLAGEYRAGGVLQYILHACHTYNVEAINVAEALKAAGIPSLKIETDYSEEDAARIGIRLEAFLESLELRNAG
jgi:benzoyl-CoA reductase/2-hydroxyglutaryl-CoA dehydratase subunit BcrC/BadD/HgdB